MYFMIILKDKKTVNCIFTRCFKRGPEFPALLHHDHHVLLVAIRIAGFHVMVIFYMLSISIHWLYKHK